MHPAGAPGTPPSQSLQITVDIETVTILASLSKKSGSFVAFAFHFCWPYLMHYFLSFFANLRASWWLHLLGHIWPGPPAPWIHYPAARVICRWRQRVIHGVRHRDWVRLSGRSSPSVAASSPHGHTGDKRDTSRRCGTCQWGGFVKLPLRWQLRTSEFEWAVEALCDSHCFLVWWVGNWICWWFPCNV